MKEIIIFMLILFSLIVWKNEKESLEISDIFIEFIDEGFSNPENLEVIDSKGNNITKEFIYKTKEYYEEEDYKAIRDIIEYEKLDVSISGD